IRRTLIFRRPVEGQIEPLDIRYVPELHGRCPGVVELANEFHGWLIFGNFDGGNRLGGSSAAGQSNCGCENKQALCIGHRKPSIERRQGTRIRRSRRPSYLGPPNWAMERPWRLHQVEIET